MIDGGVRIFTKNEKESKLPKNGSKPIPKNKNPLTCNGFLRFWSG
jgi:hypothetical protein